MNIIDVFSLKGKTILVSGASSGIGRQTAIDCSLRGANVILLGRRENELLKTFHQLSEGAHSYFHIDITEYSKLESVIAEAVKISGQISGFVHSAGVESTMPLTNMKPELYERLYATNVIAAFELTRIITKKKYNTGIGASYIYISSIMGTLGQPGKVGYCSSKGALISGCKALALELAYKKIRVNCILPAVVQTSMIQNLFETVPQESVESIIKMHPLGLGSPEDIANACIFLLSDASKWITGTTLIVDGGYSAQ